MTWSDLAELLRPYVPAAPAAWLVWNGDPLQALVWLAVFLLAVATVPAASAIGRLLTRTIDRLGGSSVGSF